MPEIQSSTLNKARNLLKEGKRNDARQLLIAYLKRNQNSAEAWWMLSYAVEDKKQKTDCVKRVLSLSPNNKSARARLEKLDKSALHTQIDEPAQKVFAPPKEESPARKKTPRQKKLGISGGIVALVVVFLCLTIAGIGYFGVVIFRANTLDEIPSPSQIVMATETKKPSQSLPPTWTPTLYATIVKLATSTPYGTPSYTDSFEPDTSTEITPNTGSFKPGDPTATPLGNDITDPNFIEGKKAYDAGNYDEAITLMNAVIEINPNLAPPYRYRGMAYWYLDDCVTGLADQKKALLINPDYAEAWADQGLIYFCLGNPKKALEYIHKALELDPSLAFAHHNLGIHYKYMGDYKKSLEELDLAIAIDPTRVSSWGAKSETLLKMGRYTGCVTNATKAISLDPETRDSYETRGYCNLLLDNYALALDDYNILVARGEATAIVWGNLGIAQNQTGLFQSAVESQSKSLALDPSNHNSYINRGMAYKNLGEYQKALNDYNKALEFGDIPEAYHGRADVYLELGQFDEAIADHKMAIALYPGEGRYYRHLACAYLKAGKYQDAIDTANAYHQLEPTIDRQRVYETQARAYYALGDYQQGLIYINKAIDLRSYSSGFYYRGIINEAAGKKEAAILDLEKFLAVVMDKDEWKDEIADAEARLAELKP